MSDIISNEIKRACRAYIDSIKCEPWYQVDYDDIILEAFAEGVYWNRGKDHDKFVKELLNVNKNPNIAI